MKAITWNQGFWFIIIIIYWLIDNINLESSYVSDTDS